MCTQAVHRRQPPSWTAGDVARRAGMFACVLGVFASTTSTGSLSAPFVVEGAFVLSWVLVMQFVFVATVVRLAGVRAGWPTVVGGYWSTHGPWIVLLLGASLVAVAAPDHQAFLWFAGLGPLVPAAFLVAWVWSLVCKAVFFRRMLGLSGARTVLVLVVLSLAFVATPLAFFVVTRQLPVPVLLGYL